MLPILGLGLQSADAAILFWDTNGTTAGSSAGTTATGSWNGVATNWNDDSTGGAGGSLTAATTAADTVTFAAGTNATGSYTVTVTGTQTAGQADFEEGTIVTFTGGSLVVGTLNPGAGRTATVGTTVLSGAGSLTKIGAGIVNLTPISTYSGDTFLNAGTTTVDADATFGSGAGTLHLNGGTLQYTASRTTAPLINPLEMTANTTIHTTGGGRVLPFSTNSYTTTGGTLSLTNAGTTLSGIRFTGGLNFTSPISLGTNTRLDLWNLIASGDQTFSGLISGVGELRRSVSLSTDVGGNSIVTGANTYTGITALNGGFLGFGSSSVLSGPTIISGPIGTNTLTIADDPNVGFFAHGGPQTVANPITLGSVLDLQIKGTNSLTMSGNINLGTVARKFSVTNTGGTTFSGALSGIPTINKAGPGSLSLTGINPFTGAITVSGGALRLDGGSIVHGKITIDAGASFDGGTALSGGTFTFNIASDVADLVAVAGTFELTNLNLILNPTGTQTLSEYVVVDKAVGSAEILGTAFKSTSLPAGWSIDYDGTVANPNAIVAVIPEPASLSLLGLAAMAALRRRRA
ncbi:MAG: autotransporter-associated beta strand repeat-containing protein [Tepidisphaeraceae bacterium]